MRGRTVRVHAGLAVFASLLVWTAAAPSFASTTAYSGRASALVATLSGETTTHTDTGELPSSGGNLDAASPSAGVPETAGAHTLHASTLGQLDYVHSEASAGGVEITAGVVSVTAEFAMSRAEAQNLDGNVIPTGRSHVDGLVLDGLPVPVTGEPNQTVPLPGGQLVVNEQITSTSGGHTSITVNALHLTVNGIDVILSSSKAGITAAPQQGCSGAADFASGGGWLIPPGETLRRTFGFVGGVRQDGTIHGHLVYRDHQSRDRLEGRVLGYAPGALPNSREMFGRGEVNNDEPTFFELTVIDNNEPGRADFFRLSYLRETDEGFLGGGNIQLHPAC